MMLIAGIIACAIGMFYAGYQRGVRVRSRRCSHRWTYWHLQSAHRGDGIYVSCNVRSCKSCGFTEAEPL